MTARRPIASLSLDLDNQWSYMKTHGDAGWEEFPSYLDLLVPRVLELLDELDLTITFFIVGQDAALEKNHAALRSIADAGHEIGNHSFKHEPWLHRYSPEELRAELDAAEEAIRTATGASPRGFRGPGFSFSTELFRQLAERGYAYDASTLPTWIGPLARAYYFRSAKLDTDKKQERSMLFGTWRDVVRPIRPYTWKLNGAGLTEIPVTTMPLFRVPIHLSYVLYLSQYSWALARAYFATAMTLCRACRVAPSMLLHPLDFLGAEDLASLEFFPGMSVSRDVKLARTRALLKRMATTFRVVTMEEHEKSWLGTAPDSPTEPA